MSKMIHPFILFVADQPANDNVSLEVPLVGTRSYKTLLEWIGEMDVDITRVSMYNQSDDPFDDVMYRAQLNKGIIMHTVSVIALGQKASTYLKKIGINNYFTLPHPSGRNHLLNDKYFVIQKLDECKRYIYNGVKDEQQPTPESCHLDESGYLSYC